MCWARVDDRLIHGQITVAWRRYLGYDEICIVDDGVRADPFLSGVLRLSAPSDVYVSVYDIQEAVGVLKAVACSTFRLTPFSLDWDEAPSLHKILLLVKTPQTALALFQGGVPMTLVNVGNIAAGPGRKRVFKSISLGPEHITALDTLAECGVNIIFQLVPDDTRGDWRVIRCRICANMFAK